MNEAMVGEDGDKPVFSVEQRILSKLDEPHKTVTMAAISKVAGVSQGAISSLLNDRDYGIRVSDKTRDRVFKACRELGYIPNDLRAVVRMYPELGDHCLIATDDIADVVGDPFCSRIASAVTRAVSNPTHSVTFAQVSAKVDYTENPELLPNPIRAGTASKFVCVGEVNPSLIQVLTKRGHPVVYLGQDVPFTGITSIVPDYAQASALAIDYLSKLGHRRIAILSGPFGASSYKITELNRGIKQSYDTLGMPIEAQNILYSDLQFKNAASCVDLLFSRKPVPTAIFCLNDDIAAGVISHACKKGIRIPEDLSVLGCSDDFFAQYLSPALTTVHIPAEEMGEMGVREVERRVKDAAVTEMKKIVLPVRLVERASCGPAQKDA